MSQKPKVERTPTRQARRLETIRVKFERPVNPNFGQRFWENGDYVWDEANGDYVRDSNRLLVDSRAVRAHVADLVCTWRRENQHDYNQQGEKLIPYLWELMDIKIKSKQTSTKDIPVDLIFGVPVFHYMVQSDWTSATGDSIPHADRNIFIDRALAEEDRDAANASPWTNGGRRGFYVAEVTVREAGSEWPSYFDYDDWARAEEQS
jgi:hypothetical protein